MKRFISTKIELPLLMAKTRFFYYEVDVKLKEGRTFDLINTLKQIKNEKETNGIVYCVLDTYRVCTVISEIKETSDEILFLGRFISSEDEQNYREEKGGDLFDLELSEEESRLCNIEKGALFFLFYFNKNTNKNLLMFESVNFSLGIGGFRNYFKERYQELEQFITKQKLGRDLKPALESVANSGLKIAHLRLNRCIGQEQLKRLGIVEKAAPLLLEEDIDCELVFRFKKRQKTFKQFLMEVFHKEDISDLMTTEFGDFFRTLSFILDNTANRKFNFFDKVFRFELPFEKLDNFTEKEIFSAMLEHFENNKAEILEQE